mgnify:CR=1 FL=1|tara:strand:- start:110 stop:715 length:606 start_codon:yes stop_codon:yes gene_type:complete
MVEHKIIRLVLSGDKCKHCEASLLEVDYDQDVDELGLESSVKDCIVCSANSEDENDFYLDILDKLNCAVCDEKADIKNGEFRHVESYRDDRLRFSCDECSKWKLIQDAENDSMLWEDDGISKLFFFHDEKFFTGCRFDNKFEPTGSSNSFLRTESQAIEDAKIELEECENPELAEFVNNSEVGDVQYGAEFNSNIDVYRIR